MKKIKNELTSKELFALPEHSLASPLLDRYTYPWEALDFLSDYIIELGNTLSEDEYDVCGNNIWIAKTAAVADSASITGPCIICEGAEIRQCAFIRGKVIVGKNAVVGNSTELKNSILFDNVQVPHFNYIGDSVLGYKAHMGAGSITSNVKSDKTSVTIKYGDDIIFTGRKKFGAILGDFVEVGCNSVLNPGSVVGRNSNIYPLSCVRGYVPKDSIYKAQDTIVQKNNI